MQREKLCPHCQTYFFYDDGVDAAGIAAPAYSRLAAGNKQKRGGFCPKCVDPHSIPGFSYEKETIYRMFVQHLRSNNIDVFALDRDIILSMMMDFPRVRDLYLSNGTYRTVTIHHGTKFTGEYGDFELLGVKEIPINSSSSHFAYERLVSCLRCKKIVSCSRKKALQFFTGLRLKRCQNCDVKYYLRPHTLQREGRVKSDKSERALAKALNVSRNDLRRHKITKPEPPLPLGTMVNGLEIINAYWDENPNVYAPRYILRCGFCEQEFIIAQKKVNCITHNCPKMKG